MKRVVLVGLLSLVSVNSFANLLAVEEKNVFAKYFSTKKSLNPKLAGKILKFLPPAGYKSLAPNASKDQVLKHYRGLVFLGDKQPSKVLCQSAQITYKYDGMSRAPSKPFGLELAKPSCKLLPVSSYDDYKVVKFKTALLAAKKANAIKNTLNKPGKIDLTVIPDLKFPTNGCQKRVCH